MFDNDLTEREYEIKKRERWLRNAKRKEQVIDAIGDFFHGTKNMIKRITHKKTPEEIELMKRELWLARSRKKEQIKAKIANIFTKKEKDDEEITDNVSNKDYDLSNFQSLLDDFVSKKEEKEAFNIESEDDFDFLVDENDDYESFDKYDEEDAAKFQSILNELSKSENEDEDLDIIKENIKIKEEISKTKEIDKKVNINLDKFKELINNGKTFIIEKTTPKDSATEFKINKITKISLGTILTLSGSVIFLKEHLPINAINGVMIAASLNIGAYTTIKGLTEKEETKIKIKVYKDLTTIGE